MKRHPFLISCFFLIPLLLSACGKKIEPQDLLSSDPDIRASALNSINQASASQKMALVTPLMSALHDEDSLVIQRAVDALQKLGPQAIPKITPALKNDDPYIRASAIDILSVYLDQDPTLVATLEPLLKDSHPLVQDEARFVLDSYKIHASSGLSF